MKVKKILLCVMTLALLTLPVAAHGHHGGGHHGGGALRVSRGAGVQAGGEAVAQTGRSGQNARSFPLS